MSNFSNNDYLSKKLKNFEVFIEQSNLYCSEIPHLQDEVEMIYVKSGEAQIEINGYIYDISKGSLVQLLPYHVHRLIKIENREINFFRCKFTIGMILFFNTKDTNEHAQLYDLEKNLPCLILDSENQNYVENCFVHMLNENKQPKNYRVELANISLIAGLLLIYERNSIKTVKINLEKDKPLIWLVMQYIYTNLNKNLTTTKTANLFGVSTNQLNFMLKKATNYTFKELLHNARIISVCGLMQFNEISLKQMGHIVGYKSESAFYEQFKKYTKMKPQEYREREKGYNRSTSVDSAKDIFQYVSENYARSITASTASQELALSKKRLNAISYENFEKSFSDFVNYYRILVSAGLLKSTTLSIEDVSLAVGFNTYRSYIRNFEEIFNMTPSNFRQVK